MKSTNRSASIVFLLAIFMLTAALSAQDNMGNVLVITTQKLAFPDKGSMAEFDSLNQLYTEKVIKKNNLILSHRTVRHLWGSDSRDFLIIYELKSMADLQKANARNNELFEQAWPDEKERKAMNDMMNKYFTGMHADEVYQELKGGRK